MADQPSTTSPSPSPHQARALAIFQGASFAGAFDRFIVVPLIGLIATDLGRSIQQATLLASSYFAAYAAMQLVWGLVSDRVGRVRTIQVALSVAGVAGLLSAVVPGFVPLLATRVVVGAGFAAAMPNAIIYIGEVVAERHRQRPLAALMIGTALGTALASVVGALVADFVSWRLAFALTAAMALVLAALLLTVPATPPLVRTPLARSLRLVGRSPWARALLVIGLAEGAVLLGSLTFIPLTFERAGLDETLSGVLFGLYGASVLGTSLLVRRWSGQLRDAHQMAIGAIASLCAFVVLRTDPAAVAIGIACLLLGFGWALLHTPMQAWATFVEPAARTVEVSLFATVLLLGGALGTSIGSTVLGEDDFAGMYTYFAASMVALGVLAVAFRAAFDRRRPLPIAVTSTPPSDERFSTP
ncbi:MAG: MFS transporter [Acidimicrobiia bacterium]